MLQLPFTTEQFFEVFSAYNRAVWPAQIGLLAFAALAVLQATRTAARRTAAPWWILACLWSWAGAVFHIGYFASINPAAYVFGASFLLQAMLLGRMALHAPPLHFRRSLAGVAGAVIIAYALVVYPVIGYLVGHRFPASPTFGAPCPVTMFTAGLLLWGLGRVPLHLLAIPALWSVVGAFAALRLGVIEDLAMPIAVGVAAFLIVRHSRRRESVVVHAPALERRAPDDVSRGGRRAAQGARAEQRRGQQDADLEQEQRSGVDHLNVPLLPRRR